MKSQVKAENKGWMVSLLNTHACLLSERVFRNRDSSRYTFCCTKNNLLFAPSLTEDGFSIGDRLELKTCACCRGMIAFGLFQSSCSLQSFCCVCADWICLTLGWLLTPLNNWSQSRRGSCSCPTEDNVDWLKHAAHGWHIRRFCIIYKTNYKVSF